jgi:hypothetical protein
VKKQTRYKKINSGLSGEKDALRAVITTLIPYPVRNYEEK